MSSSDREEEGEEIASVNGSEDEDTQGSDNDTENDSEETISSSPGKKKTPPLTLKISVTIARTLICRRP